MRNFCFFRKKLIRIENYTKNKKIEMINAYVIPESEVFCARFDPEDALLAVGTLDGVVKVYNTSSSLHYF